MWADTRIVWHIQKNSWGFSHAQLSHQVPLRCVCSTHAPPKTQTIQWIANIWDNVWSQDSPVRWDTCEGNLHWNLRKSWLHTWKWLSFTSHILWISAVGSWNVSSLLLLLRLLFKSCFYFIVIITDDCPRYFCSPCPCVPVCLIWIILSLSAWFLIVLSVWWSC